MNNLKIYSDIYDIVSENMRSSGKELTISKACYLDMAQGSPVDADIYSIAQESGSKVFLERAYCALLKWFTREDDIRKWADKISLPREEFQRQVVNSIMHSVEFSHAGVRVYNNIYSENEGTKGKASSVWQRFRLGVLERMYRVYRRQPESLKRAEKKILRVWGRL